MQTYNIFRREESGAGPSWVKGEESLEAAKREAMRLATESQKKYFVFDLSTSKVLYRTEATSLSDAARAKPL
jgi:hypothetical protein